MAAAAAQSSDAPPDLPLVLRSVPANIWTRVLSGSELKGLRLVGDPEIRSLATGMATRLDLKEDHSDPEELRKFSTQLTGLRVLHISSSTAELVGRLLSDKQRHGIKRLHVKNSTHDELSAGFIPAGLTGLEVSTHTRHRSMGECGDGR
jgi:hypothetical protein